MPVAIPLIAAGVGAAGTIAAANANKSAAKSAANASQAATDTATAEQRRQYDLSRADQQPWLQTGTAALGRLGALYGLTPQTQNNAGSGSIQSLAYPTGQYGASASYSNDPFAQMNMVGQEGIPQVQSQQVGTTQQGQAQTVPQQAGDMSGFFASPDYQFRLNEQNRALTARNAALGIQDSGAAQRSALQLSGNLASGEFNNYANRLAALAGVGQTAANTTAQLGQNYAGQVGNLATQNAANLASSYQQQGAANSNLYSGLAGIGSGLVSNIWGGKVYK